MVEPGGKGFSPYEYNPCVCEAACLKGSLMPADPLQPTFTLEISHQCIGLLLAALPATHGVFHSELWVGSFLCSLTRIAQVLVSVLSSVCHQISKWRWKDFFLTTSQQPGIDHATQSLFCPSAGLGSILPQCWREL